MTQSVSRLYGTKNDLASRTPVYRATFDRGGTLRRYSTHPICDYKSEVLADVPSGYWRLGETDGTTAADSSGNGLDGTYHFGSVFGLLGFGGSISGSSDASVLFDNTGGNDYVSVADDPLLDPGDTFSLEAWVIFNAVNTGTAQVILAKGANSFTVYELGGLLYFDKAGVGQIAISTASLSAGAWTHILVTKDGADVHLYINGVDVTGSVTDRTVVATATDLNIGRYTDGTLYLAGALDEVAIYPTVLSAERVLAHYNAGLGGQYRMEWLPVMSLPRGIAAQIEPEQGRSSISSITAEFLDADGVITELIGGVGLGGDIVTFEMGFEGLQGEEFAAVLTGKPSSCLLTSDLTGYTISVRDPQAQVNRQVFEVAAQQLSVALSDVATGLFVADALDFQADGGYLRIDDEIIQYTAALASGVPPAENAWRAVAFGTGLFVAVSSDGTITTSTEGTSWVARSAAEANSWNGICWSEDLGLFVAVGSSGTHRVMTSPDGLTWTARVHATMASDSWKAVCWSPELSLFVAVGAASIMTSPDGITWTARSEPASQSHTWTCVAWSSALGIFVALADGDNTGSNRAMSSTNGTSWTTRTITSASWSGVAWSPSLGIFVGVSQSGTPAVSSTSGTSWTDRSSAESNLWLGVCWSSDLGLFAAVASSGTHRIQTSTNGTSWTARTAAAVNAWDCVAAGAGLLVSLSTTGTGNRAQRSDDGTTWTGPTANITGLTRGVTLAGVSTTAAAHAVGATVREVIHLGPAHPMELLAALYTNIDKTGLSIDSIFVDSTRIAAVKASLGSSYEMEFVIEAQANGKAWAEQEVFRPTGTYPRTTGAGLLSVVEIAAPGTSDDVIDHDVIVAARDGAPSVTYDVNLDSVINSVKFEYGYNFLTQKFTATKEFSYADSIERFGKKPIVIQSYGFHPHLPGTAEFLEARATAILQRYANGAPLVTARVFLQKHLIEPGDIVSLTSELLPNRDTGIRGVSGRLMEVIQREIAFAEGVVNLTMLDTGTGTGIDLPLDRTIDLPLISTGVDF